MEKQTKLEASSQKDERETDDIDSFINKLASDNSVIRVKARRSLVSHGHQSVRPLLSALANKNQWVRWEAAKALSQIHNPASIEGLVKALRDRMFDVRWLSAEGLIAIGRKSIVPILKALIDYPDSVWMREGAHHVLHDLAKGDLKETLHPVLEVLEDVEAAVEAPFAAKEALDAIQKGK